jgi:hypothetical protein
MTSTGVMAWRKASANSLLDRFLPNVEAVHAASVDEIFAGAVLTRAGGHSACCWRTQKTALA